MRSAGSGRRARRATSSGVERPSSPPPRERVEGTEGRAPAELAEDGLTNRPMRGRRAPRRAVARGAVVSGDESGVADLSLRFIVDSVAPIFLLVDGQY